MSATDVLRASEKAALEGQIVSKVTGKKLKTGKKKKAGVSAGLFVTAMIAVIAGLFGTGNIIPSAISERLIEETDVQYADAVQSKILVFQQALSSGEIPDDAAEILKNNGVVVGYLENGNFVENNKSGKSSVLSYNGKIIKASEFQTAVNSDAGLYNAFTQATYSRAAYYYDDSAKAVFRKLGVSRNNYANDQNFSEVMSSVMGEGSSISVNNVVKVEKTNELGEKYYIYETRGENSETKDAATMVKSVAGKNTAGSTGEATMNAASELNAADSIAKKQKSQSLYVAFMENISKMKAGEGSESEINEAMNYLYRETENQVVDVVSGEVVTVSGSMMDSPSLYAVLSGEKINTSAVQNYSSDRILKTIENKTGVAANNSVISGTVTSSQKGLRGSVGRFSNGSAGASVDNLGVVTTTVNNSLITNDFESIGGVMAGEMLVEGAVSVGAELAKASGASAGDAVAVTSYARLTSSVLALDAEVDRMNRSPFDITSKNTFLGSIVYNLAVSVSGESIVSSFSSVLRAAGSAFTALLPAVSAEDESERYLANFGDCETLGSIGAVGSASCAMVATFDTSTLDDTFNDAGFTAFVEANTTLDKNGVRTINKNSALANYIKYNNERVTPAGLTDGGILSAISNNSSSVPFVTNILAMVQNFLGASDSAKRMASGAAFVNSSSNGDWSTYKYAQRYVSLARATEALRQYSGDETAYTNVKYFEGTENPVIAFLNDYYTIANY